MKYERRKYRIKKTQAICYVVLFLFLMPPVLGFINTTKLIINYGKLVSMVMILLFSVTRLKKLSLMSISVSLYYFSFILATIITNGNIMKSINAVAPQWLFFIYTDYMLNNKTTDYIICLSGLMKVYIIINGLILILFPDGIGMYISGYNYNQVDSRLTLLGLDNGYIKFFIVSIIIFYFVYNEKRIQRNTFYVLMLGSMLYVFSGTGVVCLVILLAYIFLLDRGRVKRAINLKTATIIGATSFFLIVIARSVDFMSSFVERFLGKDITFTGRTLLWDRAIALIGQKPFFGYGVYDYELLISSANGQAYSAHDTILQMMLMGGVVTLMTFIFMIIVCGVKLEKSYATYGKNMMIVALLTMWIAGLFENMVFDCQIILVFFLVAHYGKIAESFYNT